MASEYLAINCKLCGSSGAQTIRANSVYGGDVSSKFIECGTCGVFYQHPSLSPEEEKKFYAEEFEAFMAGRSGADGGWEDDLGTHKAANIDHIKRRTKYLRNLDWVEATVLEIGCSSGFMFDSYSELGAKRIEGVEPSGKFGGLLRAKGYSIYSDINEIPQDKVFSLITNFFVFEHMSDPRKFINTAMDHVAAKGRLICEIPLANDVLANQFCNPAFDDFYWSVAHHFYYTKQSLEYLMHTMDYQFSLAADQRYDLSNHLVWLKDGKPGGQGLFSPLLGEDLNNLYKQRLMDSWCCDTALLTVYK